ncbi:MAG: NUDIX hydrolase, partial [Prevotella sp.]|nr:NUDIX hydrolase [Prevotella sp.]
MGKEKLSTETLEQNKDIFIPNVSVDCTIFGFHSGCLKILLCKFKVSDKWMIPGGFISKDELPDEAASRVLIARTGLNDIYLKQFYFLGKKPNNEDIIDKTSSLNSSISLAYYA